MKKLLIVFFLVGCSIETVETAEGIKEDIFVTEEVTNKKVSERSYLVVDTNQSKSFNNMNVITDTYGTNFEGQDSDFNGYSPEYEDNGDGTVSDLVTGLMWSQSPDINDNGVINSDDKLTYEKGMESAGDLNLAGYSDWRIPSIKELYSLIMFSGQDISGYSEGNTDSFVPFINTDYFDFAYGDVSSGERLIDSQYMSSTLYVDTDNYDTLLFGVNFADGRIKGYGLQGMGGTDKTFAMIYVRGEEYGTNSFVDNGNTVSDVATGLMWSSTDFGTMTWEEALTFASESEHAEFSDWRLPNAKELQSIVDYSKSPDTTNSAAISDLFELTKFINEDGEEDYGYYLTSTTHENMINGGSAVYISFGRAMGYMQNSWLDVHGAGAQRSDPKIGDITDYPYGHGPQGDAIRIENYVLLVRDIKTP